MSSKNLNLQITFNAIDRATAPIKNLMQGSAQLATKVSEAQKQLDKLKKIDVDAKEFSDVRKQANER